MAKAEMRVEFDQRGLRVMERMAKALEESNRLHQRDTSTNAFEDSQNRAIRQREATLAARDLIFEQSNLTLGEAGELVALLDRAGLVFDRKNT